MHAASMPADGSAWLVGSMVKDLPAAEYGPNIGFREFSLLGKRQMPKAVREDVFEVHTCAAVRLAQPYACPDCQSAQSNLLAGLAAC